MPKRTLAVLGMAAFAGLALQFGLPRVAQASGTIGSISYMPFPIAQPGTLSGGTPIQLCIQPRNTSGGTMGVGQTVWLSFYSGLFTAPPAPGGTAKVDGTTSLTTTPAPFTTEASCTPASGTPSAFSIPVTYTSPATIPPHGRDVLIAADSSADSGSGGTCSGSGVCNNDTYVYSPVAHYAFSVGPPIAPSGSLAAGAQVIFSVTAEDTNLDPVPGAFINFKLTSTASPEGTATAFNHFSGFPKDKITNTVERFGSDSNAQVQVTFTASGATVGTDTITAQDFPHTPTFTQTTSYTYGSAPPPSKAPYTAVTPFRVCDTRPVQPGIASNQCNSGSPSGPITNNSTRAVHVTGGVVPSTASAIVVNLTAIAPTARTLLALYPTGGTRGVSNVNPLPGQVVAVLVEVGIGSGGDINVYNNVGTINIAMDIEGYVDASSTGMFNPTAPTRICDTRAAGGGIPSNQCNDSSPGAHPLGPKGILSFIVSDSGSPVPSSGVTAVVFNLTAISPSVRTDLAAYPGNLGTPPGVSNVNLEAGQAVANRVIVPVPSGCSGATCTVRLWNSAGNVNVAVDIDGWFGAAGSQFTALPSPARICDTRFGGNAQGCANPGKIAAGAPLNLNVTGIDGIPSEGGAGAPVALVANITAVDATTGTFVTVYPGNLGTPNASDLNVPNFNPVTNLVVVGIDPATGTINIANDVGFTDVIVDVFGYYS